MSFSAGRFFLGSFLSFCSVAAMANGFAINVQSASGVGTGEAGRASTALDATVIYGNPAGLVRLDRPQLVSGFGFVKADVGISDAWGMTATGSPVVGTNQGDSVPDVYVPFAFASTPINDRWAVGIGIYVPFGLINDYEPTFMGRYHGVHSKVSVVTIQPTVSFKVNDRLSIGFGPTINRISGRLKNNMDARMLGGGEGMVDIKGSDSGVMGFNFGVMFDPTDFTTLGLTYHSRVDYKLTGRTRFSGLGGSLAAVNGRYDANLDVTLPESVDMAITQRLSDKWTVYGGATWTRWSRFQALDIYNTGMPVASLRHLNEKFNWENTWSFALGASYQIRPGLVLRAGLTYDPSPTNSEYRNVRIPVGDRHIFALGAGWTPTPDWTFDFAYTYLWENTATINQPVKSAFVPSYHARYKNSAHGFAFQVTRRF